MPLQVVILVHVRKLFTMRMKNRGKVGELGLINKGVSLFQIIYGFTSPLLYCSMQHGHTFTIDSSYTFSDQMQT